MKFLLFADFHYYPGVFRAGSREHLHTMQQAALREGCDFIIHAGDFAHWPDRDRDLPTEYRNFSLPSYHVLGNHDADRNSLARTLEIYAMPSPYYYFDCKGYRMICCDSNYYLEDGQYVHFENKNNWRDGLSAHHIPPEQLRWLEAAIRTSPHPCVIISHASPERPGSMQNGPEVMALIAEANARRPGSVLMYINGHHHTDNLRIFENVCYFDVNSAFYYYLPNPHTCYGPELESAWRGIGQTITYTEPLYAVVELCGRRIDIRSTTSELLCGVTPEMTGHKAYSSCGREILPRMQSASFTLE